MRNLYLQKHCCLIWLSETYSWWWKSNRLERPSKRKLGDVYQLWQGLHRLHQGDHPNMMTHRTPEISKYVNTRVFTMEHDMKPWTEKDMTTTFSSLKQNKTGETNKQWEVESKFLKDIHNQNHHFKTTLTLGNRDITRVVGTSHIYGTVLILQTPTFS